MIKLPSLIPLPSQELTIKRSPATIRSTMESGRSRQRNRFTSAIVSADVKWFMTDEEYQLFEAFIMYEADGGAAWFKAPFVTGGQVSDHIVRLVDGIFDASYTAYDGWVVSANLDIQKTNHKSKMWYYLISTMGNDADAVIAKVDYAANDIFKKQGS